MKRLPKKNGVGGKAVDGGTRWSVGPDEMGGGVGWSSEEKLASPNELSGDEGSQSDEKKNLIKSRRKNTEVNLEEARLFLLQMANMKIRIKPNRKTERGKWAAWMTNTLTSVRPRKMWQPRRRVKGNQSNRQSEEREEPSTTWRVAD